MKNGFSDKLNWKRIFAFSGAIIAYMLGSGFVSGQESMQFYSAFGIKGALGLIFSLLIYTWFCSTVMNDGYILKLDSGYKIFEFYCGKILGKLYEIYTPIFLFMLFCIMISGTGELLTETYNLDPQTGRVIMALLTLGTVLLGLKNLVNIVSKLGPMIIVFGIIIGLTNIFLHPEGIVNADKVIADINVVRAAPTWYVASIICPSMGCIMIAPFLATLCINADSKKEAKYAGMLGGFIFSVAASIMALGVMATIGDLYSKNIPSLFIAHGIFPPLGVAFSLILFAGIYTTSVPMLWLSCNALVINEKTIRFKFLVILAAIVGFIGGQLPFGRLINVLFPITGYLGLLLFGCILIKKWRE